MKLDSSGSYSTADEIRRFQLSDNNDFPKGKRVSEPDIESGPVVEKYPVMKPKDDDNLKNIVPIPWCYIFVHHKKVKSFEAQLEKDNRKYFIHTSVKYVPKRGTGKGVKEKTVQTVSGLIFLKGSAVEVQKYLDENLPSHRLCKNCSTGEVAEIPNSQMEPFMRIVKTDSDRIRFLLRPFIYYSKNRTLLRIVSGDYAGLEGYVIRMARDRKLVMNIGGMSVAIGGIHAERFEEVGKNEASNQERATFYKRNLHERNAFIDRYFHKVKTSQDVKAQTENIDILREQTLADVKEDRLDVKDAYDTFYFMIEEIGYYYAPFIDYFKDELRPIFEAGKKVMQEIERIIANPYFGTDARMRHEAEYESLSAQYGYLFE